MRQLVYLKRTTIIFLLCLFFAGTTAQALASAATRHGVVTWVYDGDTIQVQGIGTVRLIGIDCPEKVESDRDWKYLKMGCKDRGTLRASSAATLKQVIKLCKGKKVQLQGGSDGTDRYGRMLAYVWLPDGRMLNRIMLQEGRAMVYRRFNFIHKDDFIEVETTARHQQRGIWAGFNKKDFEKAVNYSVDPHSRTK
ncbi:MAG: thermonuclease family protein [Desulfuromonas sp.]|nr:thermonuclease family protein [Desulfuromonas sp.]